MKFNIHEIPREFKVGENKQITLKDMGQIHLESDEQVTFITSEKNEYDVCRKEWGFYATPSINDRLKRFGFKTALVKNTKGQVFVMLVDANKTDKFFQYLNSELNELICWLDESIIRKNESQNLIQHLVCPICKSSGIQLIKHYEKPPIGENNFNISNYRRDLCRCLSCEHIFNHHNYDFNELYKTNYVSSVYKDKLKDHFQKILSLPEDKSDNNLRVKRVYQLAKDYIHNNNLNVLDIGSGLCVFLYKLKQETGWNCTALDPDVYQAQHARDCGIEAIHQSLFDYSSEKNFDLITFNKVLEHFQYPLDALKKIKSFSNKTQYLYIEVPDGEMAVMDSPDREEFFIEHYHAFSYESLQQIMKESGWKILSQVRLREPSGKFTIYCFAKNN